MLNKEFYIHKYSIKFLVFSVLLVMGNVLFASPESAFDKVKKFENTEKYSVPFSSVKVVHKSINQNISDSNFTLIFSISLVVVLVINGLIVLAVLYYFKKKNSVVTESSKIVQTVQAPRVEEQRVIEEESADEGIRFAQRMGRGYGEISVLQNLRLTHSNKNYYERIVGLTGGKNKRGLINAAKKLGIGSGEVMLALKLKKLAEEKV